MSLHKLIIGNEGNENMVGDPARYSYDMRCDSSIIANRLAWLLENGDSMLLPYPISQEFLVYVAGFNGLDLDSISVIVPQGAEKESKLLTFDVLSSNDILGKLESIISDPDNWTVTPYFFDRSVAWMARRLHLRVDDRVLNFFAQGGAELLNSKVHFRRIAAAHDIPVAEGVDCSSKRELSIALEELIPITGTVIVKEDLNSGGEGNVLVTRSYDGPSTGAIDKIQIDSRADFDILAEDIWTRHTGPRNIDIVVEAYYPWAAPYYTELEIQERSRRPVLLNFGKMRMEPIFNGFEIPCHELTSYQLSEVTTVSMKLADIAREMGYVGKINIDAIRSLEGRILFTEVNGRLGGCSHIHQAAVRLFGPDYGSHYSLLTRNKVKTGNFKNLLQVLESHGLLYRPNLKSGVIILTEDTGRTGSIEYMVASPDIADAREIEQNALQLFEESRKL